MKAPDTNVLVRYLVQDEPAEGARAAEFIDSCSREVPCYINRIVLCELVWVLARAYGYSRPTVADVLERILRTSQFVIEDLDVAWKALRSYRQGPADYADCLLAVSNKKAGCDMTVTFDRKAGRMMGFELL